MENKYNYDPDPEFTGYKNACVDNLILEVQHLREFLADKDESYIRSNPDEVMFELINSGLTAAHINGAYCTLDAIRETGMPARITFRDEEGEE